MGVLRACMTKLLSLLLKRIKSVQRVPILVTFGPDLIFSCSFWRFQVLFWVQSLREIFLTCWLYQSRAHAFMFNAKLKCIFVVRLFSCILVVRNTVVLPVSWKRCNPKSRNSLAFIVIRTSYYVAPMSGIILKITPNRAIQGQVVFPPVCEVRDSVTLRTCCKTKITHCRIFVQHPPFAPCTLNWT